MGLETDALTVGILILLEPFINIDLGPSLQNPADVTETRTDTVLPDDLLTPTFTQTALSDSGTGTGNQGGFNIGRHIRFYGGTSNTNRIVEWEFDNDVIDNITFSAIRGTDFNGGEDPDTTDESLYLDYYDGSSWVRIDTVVAYNDTNFNTLNSVAIAIPLTARAAGTRYRLIQPAQSGGYFDNYGITSISYSYSYTYNPLVIIDHGSVLDQEAYTLEDWGRIIYEDTNFPFGELRPVSNTTWTVVHAWVGSGTVFERGDTYYRLVAPYCQWYAGGFWFCHYTLGAKYRSNWTIWHPVPYKCCILQEGVWQRKSIQYRQRILSP